MPQRRQIYEGKSKVILWDARTNEKRDEDRFREDLGRVEEGYQEARRLGIVCEAGPGDVAASKMRQ